MPSNVKLGPEHFWTHLIRSGGLHSLGTCVLCLVVVCGVAFFFVSKILAARQQEGDAATELRRRQYEDLLGHIRGLEALRVERELLVKRTLRIVQSWHHMLPSMAKPVDGSADKKKTSSGPEDEKTKLNRKALTMVEDLAEEVRLMKREHQLLMRSTIMALGEHDTAGILKPDMGSAIWQQALEKAQRDVEKRLREEQAAKKKQQEEEQQQQQQQDQLRKRTTAAAAAASASSAPAPSAAANNKSTSAKGKKGVGANARVELLDSTDEEDGGDLAELEKNK